MHGYAALSPVTAGKLLGQELIPVFDATDARYRGETSLLGEILEMGWDSVRRMLAGASLVTEDRAPAIYLLVGLARCCSQWELPALEMGIVQLSAALYRSAPGDRRDAFRFSGSEPPADFPIAGKMMGRLGFYGPPAGEFPDRLGAGRGWEGS